MAPLRVRKGSVVLIRRFRYFKKQYIVVASTILLMFIVFKILFKLFSPNHSYVYWIISNITARIQIFKVFIFLRYIFQVKPYMLNN